MDVATGPSNWQGCTARLDEDLLGWGIPDENLNIGGGKGVLPLAWLVRPRGGIAVGMGGSDERDASCLCLLSIRWPFRARCGSCPFLFSATLKASSFALDLHPAIAFSQSPCLY